MGPPGKVESIHSSQEITQGTLPSHLSSLVHHDSSPILTKALISNSNSTPVLTSSSSPPVSFLPFNSTPHSHSHTTSTSSSNSNCIPNTKSNSNSNPANPKVSPNLKNSHSTEPPFPSPVPPSLKNHSTFTLHPTTRSTLDEFLSMEKVS